MPADLRSGAVCKLCGGPVERKFPKLLIKKFQADYHLCTSCGSLQILDTGFLPEAYRTANWALDTGLVARNIVLATALASLFDGLVLRPEPIIDYGGGTGLLTRLLRDMGWNCLCYDRYGTPSFVAAFHVKSLERLRSRVTIASEVIEHFDSPRSDLEQILHRTDMLVFTTELYAGQGEDWWYLAPFTGQHVFFWSRKALVQIFRENGFQYAEFGFFKLAVKDSWFAQPGVQRQISAWAQAASSLSLNGAAARPMLEYLANPFRNVGPDYQREKALYERGSPPA